MNCNWRYFFILLLVLFPFMLSVNADPSKPEEKFITNVGEQLLWDASDGLAFKIRQSSTAFWDTTMIMVYGDSLGVSIASEIRDDCVLKLVDVTNSGKARTRLWNPSGGINLFEGRPDTLHWDLDSTKVNSFSMTSIDSFAIFPEKSATADPCTVKVVIWGDCENETTSQIESEPESDNLLAVKTTGFSIGLISDAHISQGVASRWDRLATCIDWAQTTAIDLCAILFAGDGDSGKNAMLTFKEWIYSTLPDGEGASLSRLIPVWPALGNHDTYIANSDLTTYPIPNNPHSTSIIRFDKYFKGGEWYFKNINSVRAIAINDNSPYIDDSGDQMYRNCNPPGDFKKLNDDHSGITVAGSSQRLWLDQVTASQHIWKIIFGHRSLWAPLDDDPRKLNRLARPAMATPINNGADILFTGDLHLTSVNGPYYPTPPDYEDVVDFGGLGIYSITTSGGYVGRPVDDEVLPEGSTYYSYGDNYTPESSIILLDFFGDLARLRVFQVTEDDLDGAVVFDTTLIQNPGVVS